MIRPTEAGDEAALAKLMTQLGYPSSEPEMRSRLKVIGRNSHFMTFVAVEDGEVCGMIGLGFFPSFEHNDHTGIILALSIEENSRRNGIGRQLVAASEDFFRVKNVRRVIVNTRLEREGAHRYYEALGFTKTGFRFGKII
jgi:ribosomal protein S18 acetylase RimI-like enzyme